MLKWKQINQCRGVHVRVITVDFDGTLYQGNSFKVMFDVAKNSMEQSSGQL